MKSGIPAQLHYRNRPGHPLPGNAALTRMRLHSSLLPGHFCSIREQRTKPGLKVLQPALAERSTNAARLHPCQPARKGVVQSSPGSGVRRGGVIPGRQYSSLQLARSASRPGTTLWAKTAEALPGVFHQHYYCRRCTSGETYPAGDKPVWLRRGRIHNRRQVETGKSCYHR